MRVCGRVIVQSCGEREGEGGEAAGYTCEGCLPVYHDSQASSRKRMELVAISGYTHMHTMRGCFTNRRRLHFCSSCK